MSSTDVGAQAAAQTRGRLLSSTALNIFAIIIFGHSCRIPTGRRCPKSFRHLFANSYTPNTRGISYNIGIRTHVRRLARSVQNFNSTCFAYSFTRFCRALAGVTDEFKIRIPFWKRALSSEEISFPSFFCYFSLAEFFFQMCFCF